MLNRIKGKIVTLLLMICSTITSGCAGDNVKHTLHNIPQNIWNYIDPALIDINLMDPDDQQKHMTDYMSHYFSPWTNQNRIATDQQIQQSEITYLQKFTQQPGWGENHQPYSEWWIKKIINTMDIAHFPNNKHKAVVIDTSDLRLLPTISS